jgi:RNA polymerase sigma-70 factor (ECF subfamily)
LAEAQTDIHRDLIELSKNGDRMAQYRLYQLYAKAMFNVAWRMMNSREEAEDMLQDSFTDAFSRMESFRYESSFGTWLKRIVVNNCLNEIKRKKANLEYVDDIQEYDAKPEEYEGYKPWLSVDNVRKAMEKLPDGSRMIFSLYLLEGYDHREIAQILNISESNSKSQYMRARLKVKEILITMGHEAR